MDKYIGKRLDGRYEIHELLGVGGMAYVYKAYDNIEKRWVAIKILKEELAGNSDFLRRFRNESKAIAVLSHPNIVKVYDVSFGDRIQYIVMEYIDGITLKQYIEQQGEIKWREALYFTVQILRALQHAHEKGIIHRDIKPQNIMISKEGKVKIADFGIAKAATSNTITSNVMGSVHYTSPEQARGGFSDERSDIYSLGCTMFEMLTGRVPFDGETTVAIAIKHIQEDMPSPREYVSEIPVCVEQIIFKCTQKSPDRRYQSMGELIVDLKKALITPDEDFVKMVPFDAGGETRTISEEDIAEIKQRTDRIDLDAPMRLKDREVQKNSYSPKDEEEEEQPEKPVRQEQISSKYKPVVEEDPDDMDEEDNEEEYEDDDMDPKMERITTILAIVAAVIIGILALVLVANALGVFKSSPKTDSNITQDETTDESKVKMISVEGMNIEDAKKALNDIGLGTRVTKEESDTYEVDQVISQDVEEGEEVDMYSTIALVVSSGSNGVAVPNVTGQEEAAAKSTLEAAGFKVNVTQSSSDSVQEGLVISQDPTADSKAENGATITLTVSTGPEIKKVKVPDLRGMTESAAKSKLAEYGLNCGTVSETYSDTVTEGCVVSQSYSPDSEVDEGTSVNIQLSVGPEKHTYKYVTTLNAPSGYTSGNVTVTITASDGTTRSFTTSSFPCAVNETGFNVSSGTLTYSYTATTMQTVIDSETGEETEEPITEDVTTSPVTVQFEQE